MDSQRLICNLFVMLIPVSMERTGFMNILRPVLEKLTKFKVAILCYGNFLFSRK